MTPQYAGLRTLHDENHGKGFNVLAFPCNQFGGQEPGTNAEVLEFAQSKYGVDFPMFEKVDVNGPGASAVYTFLKAGHPDESGNEDIAWNFTKFLVGRDGQVIERFGPQVTPEDIAGVLAENLQS
jgi:glutathione peroxidase